MHDAAQMEVRGVPTVTLAHDRFESAARAQAKMMSLPDLPIVVVPQNVYYDTRTERVKQSADGLYDSVVKGLTSAVKARAPRSAGYSSHRERLSKAFDQGARAVRARKRILTFPSPDSRRA